MGILGTIVKHTIGKAVGKAVAYKASEVAIVACDEASKKITEASQKKIDSYFENTEDGHSRLIVGQKPYTFKESFSIFDERENVKYIVKGKLISAKHNLTIYDSTGKKVLGRVKEKLISLRSPLSLEAHPADFDLEILDKKIGRMKSRFAFGKQKFEFSFNDWVVEGNILGLKYKLRSESETIMEVSQKVWNIGDTYFVDIAKPEEELLCVLVLLAIDSANASKSSDNKRTIKRATRPIRRWF